jgi:phosphate/sulfate permease
MVGVNGLGPAVASAVSTSALSLRMALVMFSFSWNTFLGFVALSQLHTLL